MKIPADHIIGVTQAKAHLLTLVDQVEEKREHFVLTRNGKAVAQVSPMPLASEDPIFGFYAGKLEIVGDILSPLYSNEEFEGFEKKTVAQLHGSR